MDKCGICQKPATQLFETGNDVIYACSKCQPLVPEVTIDDSTPDNIAASVTISVEDEDDHDGDGSAQLYCGLCEKTFQKNVQLQNHLRNHRAERRFVCTYCSKAFSQSNNLRAHLRIHTNERPYKCNECGKAFTQVTNLNNHVRLHTGERPFVCPEPGCNKAYAQVTNLNQHRKRHLNGRPVENTYDCTVCGEQFQQRNHMYSHRRLAHAEIKSPVLSTQQHQCKLCDHSFVSENQLMRHMNEHASTAPASSDDDHTDKREYACVFSVCAMRFSSPREHTEHLLRAHQLRVLAAPTLSPPPKRGRPPKNAEKNIDPLALRDGQKEVFVDIETESEIQPRFIPKLRVQSLFQ